MSPAAVLHGPPTTRHEVIVAALEAAVVAIHIGHGGVPVGQSANACPKCEALIKIDAALAALGK